MCDIVFEKTQCRGNDSKKNECLCGSSRPKGSLKKALWEILQNSQENICAGVSFLIKFELCRSAALVKTSL